MIFIFAFIISFVVSVVALPFLLGWLRFFNFYTTVNEGQCKVYVLFGKVLGVIDQPGLHLLWLSLGPQAALVHFFGKVYPIDQRLDQEYLRSNPVNSEEGTPMGVGVWYEMRIKNPVDFIFKNVDPGGSLRANVANATVRSLSNMPLEKLLVDRHEMSRLVRQEVSPKSQEWGYELGSIYIRKVHFRDAEMIRQIEQKVVNRLRQVTAAIRQAGANQVSVIASSAENQASVEFARAAAIRPSTLGQALREIAQQPTVASALFDILETQKLLASDARLTLLAAGPDSRLLADLLAGTAGVRPTP